MVPSCLSSNLVPYNKNDFTNIVGYVTHIHTQTPHISRYIYITTHEHAHMVTHTQKLTQTHKICD